jgi:damage-control phosphatase, subfamily III
MTTTDKPSPKLIPWFVSDVTPPDFKSTLDSLDTSFFSSPTTSDYPTGCLERLVTRWRKYVDDGTFALSVPMHTTLGGTHTAEQSLAEFWTMPWPYWDMKIRAPDLWECLTGSELVIFKV